MKARREASAAWALGITIILIMGAGLVWLAPVSAQDSFAGTGQIQAPSLASVTVNEFARRCTYPPASQGRDAYVFQIPTTLGGKTAVASGPSGVAYDLDMYFFSSTCGDLGNSNEIGTDETAPVPANTAYIGVHSFLLDPPTPPAQNMTACLRINTTAPCPTGSATPTGSGTPTGSATPTATASSPQPTQTPTATPTPSPSPSPTPTRKCTISGTSKGETLRGTPASDRICGKGGNDKLLGLGGNDKLVGGPGKDVLKGGPGRDNCIGGTGKDRFKTCEKKKQ